MMISYEIGCRYFELSYPFDLGEKGLCILSNFNLMYTTQQIDLDYLNKYELNKYEVSTLDLCDKIYETDTNLIKDNCACFTCENKYTRAYIHHLLKCKELNANILIIM